MNVGRYRKVLRMEQDAGASAGERDNARRLRQRMEAEHPGIRQAATRAAAQEGVDDAEKVGASDGPGPYETGYYGPPRPQGGGLGDRLRSFVQAAMDEVGSAFTLSDMIRQDVDIEIQSNTRTLHVHVRIPLDALDRAADFTGGSLQEYARLVGVQVGGYLSSVLRED
jgi:hypothetical protein